MAIDALGTAATNGKEIPDITRDSETYFLLTSLTAGSSNIITATSRLEVLLVTMKVPFVAVDIATNEKAKALWKRRGNGKRLPVVVFDGQVLGNFEDLEQANEFGEFKQTLGVPIQPDVADSITRKPSIMTLASETSTKPSAPPVAAPEPEPVPVPTPMAHAVAKAAALAAEKKKSSTVTTASSASSIRSVRSVASTIRKPMNGPTPKVEEPAPKVEETVPKVEEVAPKVEEIPPKVEETTPKVEEPAVEVSVVEETPVVVEEVPKVKEAPKTAKATGGMRNRASVPAAAKRTSAAPTAKTVAERAIKATGRASIDEKRNSISRSSSRASSLRPESRISVRPDSKAAKRTTLTTSEKKAPSITARSVKSTSSVSTAKPVDRGLKNGKKDKARLDKLKKEEVK